MLPLNVDVISHYYFLRKFRSNTDRKFLKELPYFNDLKNDTVNDVYNQNMENSKPSCY